MMNMICKLNLVLSFVCLFVYSKNDNNFVSAKYKNEISFKNFSKPEKKIFNGTKEDRAALFSHPRVLPFLDQLLNPYLVPAESTAFGVPPPIGVLAPQIGPLRPGRPAVGSFLGNSRPDCADNGLFCLYDNTYPRDQINTIINRYYDDVRDMYFSLNRHSVNDLLAFDNKTHRYREGGHFVCETKVEYVRPGWARNLRGDWLAIINTDIFPQVVRVEECKFANRRCEYLPPCYKSSCVQRYSFEKLLCVDPLRPEGRPIVDIFEIPNACSCFVENFVYY